MSYEVTGDWVKYPDLTTICVKKIGEYAVDQHNKKTGDDLKLDKVIDGAYLEIDDDTLKHQVTVTATNSKGVQGTYGGEVLVEKIDGKIENSPISFEPGILDQSGLFWKKIPYVEEECVQQVSKFAVEKNNEITGDNLIYESTVEGWYREVKPDTIDYDLYIKAKDCFGRVRVYRAEVAQQKPLTQKILSLKSFKITPRKC